MSHATHTPELLFHTLQAAAEVAQQRVGAPVVASPGQPPQSSALLRFEVTFGASGSLTWFVSNEDATGFSDLLIGGSGNRGAELTEQHLDALSGVFSDMLEKSVETLGEALGQPIPAGGVDMGMEGALPDVAPGGERTICSLDVQGFGQLTIVASVDAALALVIANAPGPQAAAPAAPAAPAAMAPAQPVAQQPVAAAPGTAEPAHFDTAPAGATFDNVVQLPNLTTPASGAGATDLSMLLNVRLPVTVELGNTERTVRDLLDLGVGSILELNKLAGDPMDIMVNGKVLARGEVVVIDEEFGIRITEILSPEQRLRNLG